MSYQTAQQYMTNVTRGAQSAMQSSAAPMAQTAAMTLSLIETDRISGLFLLLVVVVISMLLLSSGSGGG